MFTLWGHMASSWCFTRTLQSRGLWLGEKSSLWWAYRFIVCAGSTKQLKVFFGLMQSSKHLKVSHFEVYTTSTFWYTMGANKEPHINTFLFSQVLHSLGGNAMHVRASLAALCIAISCTDPKKFWVRWLPWICQKFGIETEWGCWS